MLIILKVHRDRDNAVKLTGGLTGYNNVLSLILGGTEYSTISNGGQMFYLL